MLRTLPDLFFALTGWGQDADRQKPRDSGFDYHRVKPVDPRHVDLRHVDPRHTVQLLSRLTIPNECVAARQE